VNGAAAGRTAPPRQAPVQCVLVKSTHDASHQPAHLVQALGVRHHVAAADGDVAIDDRAQQRANHPVLLLASPDEGVAYLQQDHGVHLDGDMGAHAQQDGGLLRCHAHGGSRSAATAAAVGGCVCV
jgi:hypothetical protein